MVEVCVSVYYSISSIECADYGLEIVRNIEKDSVNIYRKTENCYTRGNLKCNQKINFVQRGFQI